jgi:hypothetical protein
MNVQEILMNKDLLRSAKNQIKAGKFVDFHLRTANPKVSS